MLYLLNTRTEFFPPSLKNAKYATMEYDDSRGGKKAVNKSCICLLLKSTRQAGCKTQTFLFVNIFKYLNVPHS